MQTVVPEVTNIELSLPSQRSRRMPQTPIGNIEALSPALRELVSPSGFAIREADLIGSANLWLSPHLSKFGAARLVPPAYSPPTRRHGIRGDTFTTYECTSPYPLTVDPQATTLFIPHSTPSLSLDTGYVLSITCAPSLLSDSEAVANLVTEFLSDQSTISWLVDWSVRCAPFHIRHFVNDSVDDASTGSTVKAQSVSVGENRKAEEGSLDPNVITKKLVTWLGITYAQLAEITGIGRTTFFDWRRSQRSARPSTTQSLLRVYALARAIVGHFGETDAAAWFRAGQPSTLDHLLSKNFDAAEQAAARVLFGQPRERPVNYAAYAPESDVDVGITENLSGPQVRRSKRSTRRGRLPVR